MLGMSKRTGATEKGNAMIFQIHATCANGKVFNAPVMATSIWNARARFLRFYPGAIIHTIKRRTEMWAITRANVDALLDAGLIECAMTNGKWLTIRRNGATKRWKKDANRIYIPFKVGFRGYGQITETDFIGNCPGALNPSHFRKVETR